jgi:hypothetical protein
VSECKVHRAKLVKQETVSQSCSASDQDRLGEWWAGDELVKFYMVQHLITGSHIFLNYSEKSEECITYIYKCWILAFTDKKYLLIRILVNLLTFVSRLCENNVPCDKM